MLRLAFATAIAHAGRDDDLPALLDACAEAGVDAVVRAWDDPSVAWRRFDAVLIRSTWDYTQRLPEFLAWCGRVSAQTELINPLPVIRWNTDKHYLGDLAAQGVPVVATRYVEPDHEPLPALQAFLSEHALREHADAAEFVVKPVVGAGSHDAQRYTRAQEFAAANHIARLLEAGCGVMLQPYLASVDRAGETGLIHFAGEFSHAIRKGPQLSGQPTRARPTDGVTARTPDEDERALAMRVLAAASTHLGMDRPFVYARVDLIRASDGTPRLLELELCEPALFLAQGPGSAARLAKLLSRALTR